MTRKATIMGIPVEVVSNEQAELADLVMCAPASMERIFDDDIETVCADCGAPIIHRPSAPKRPRKVCMDCVLKATARKPS